RRPSDAVGTATPCRPGWSLTVWRRVPTRHTSRPAQWGRRSTSGWASGRSRRGRCTTRPDHRRGSPAPLAPLAEGRALGTEDRVPAVPRIDPGRVVEDVEHTGGDVLDETVEALARVLGVAHAAGEERVAGEQVGGAVRVDVGQRDGAGRVAAQVHDVEV